MTHRLALLPALAFLSSFPSQADMRAALERLPLHFEENRGQAGKEVKFLARGSGYTIFLTAHGSLLSLAQNDGRKPVLVESRLVGANPSSRVTGEDRLAGKGNYILGNNPARWTTDVLTYGRVKYTRVYPGIDLVYYGDQGRLEYDFLVAPGADPNVIQFAFEGVGKIEVDGRGDLLLDTAGGPLRWRKPSVFQLAAGSRKAVEGKFVIRGGKRAGFRVADYDTSLPLVIDPVLTYATYYGGNKNESPRGFAVDSSGNVYIAGFTTSTTLPGTATSYQRAYGGQENMTFVTGDAFVAKLNPTGTALVYSTYLGGSASDLALNLAVDSAGNAYVTGYTRSTNFPVTSNAFQKTYQGAGGNTWNLGGDAFVTKLNAAGNALLYSTYLGGERDDRGMAITVDSAGNAYVAGATLSRSFPATTGAFQKSYGGEGGMPIHPLARQYLMLFGDAFVAKLNTTSGALSFCTYLGGTKEDAASAIALDEAGFIYLAGGTLSSDFPVTPGAFQTAYHGYGTPGNDYIRLGDGFVTKMKPDGSGLVYSTYLGGKRDDSILGLALDADKNVYVAGFTNSTDFPTTSGVLQTAYGGNTSATVNELIFGDAFVSKLNPSGDKLLYSTYLGGSLDDAAWAIAVDPSRSAYVAGHTQSRNFPVTADAIQKTFGGETGGDGIQTFGDAFVAKLSPNADKVLYGTYLGGTSGDGATGMVLDAAGNGYVTGATSATNFPTTSGAYMRALAGRSADYGYPPGDVFAVKIGQLFQPPPLIVVTHAASYATGGVSPGELVTLFGENIGPETLVGLKLNAAGLVDTTLAETRIFFDNVPSALIYVWARQSSAVVPYGVAGKQTTQLQVEYKGQRSPAVPLAVTASAPGLFSLDSSGKGPGAILNQDYTVNTPANAADSESIVILYGTGEGQTDPPGVDGKPASDVFPAFTLPRSVTIGGKAAEVQYAGAAPYFVAGVFQMNVKLPAGLAPGNHDVVVTIGNAKSQTGLTVAVK